MAWTPSRLAKEGCLMAGETTARGYGHRHQIMRKRVARSVRAGTAVCARCGLGIAPGSEWHLDHTDDRSGYLGPSHAECNLRAAAAKTNRRELAFSVSAGRTSDTFAEGDRPKQRPMASHHWHTQAGYRPQECPKCWDRLSACDEVLQSRGEAA